MKLEHLFEQEDNTTQLMSTQLMLNAEFVDIVYIISDVPNTVSDNQIRQLLKMSIPANPSRHNDYCFNHFEQYVLQKRDVAEVIQEYTLGTLHVKVTTWKDLFTDYSVFDKFYGPYDGDDADELEDDFEDDWL